MSAAIIKFGRDASAEGGVGAFPFGDKTIRVVDQGGEPWFVMADVCRAAGIYIKANGKVHSSRAVDSLDENEKGVRKIGTPGGPQNAIIVSESGMYKFILRAHPDANKAVRAFQNWVTQIVLPAIRKDGGYILGEEKVVSGEMTEDELLLKAFTVLKTKVDRLTHERDTLAAELNNVTVDEFRALKHEYWTLTFKQRLGQVATMMATSRGISLEKQPRQIKTMAGVKESAVNVYPRDILEEALEFVSARGNA